MYDQKCSFWALAGRDPAGFWPLWQQNPILWVKIHHISLNKSNPSTISYSDEGYWTMLDFTQLSQVPQAQIREPCHLSNDSKNQKRFWFFSVQYDLRFMKQYKTSRQEASYGQPFPRPALYRKKSKTFLIFWVVVEMARFSNLGLGTMGKLNKI